MEGLKDKWVEIVFENGGRVKIARGKISKFLNMHIQ